VRSLPDGVAQALATYLEETAEEQGKDPSLAGDNRMNGNILSDSTETDDLTDQPFLKIGDLCPECGQAAVINEEGCRKCYACGYSEC
jgi:ribonucleoside-diphosphate reductase alpha chain